jgi:NAD(P)H-hydrate epimerase
MSKIYFHPDIDYHGIKGIEKKYNSVDKNYLIDKVSDFICKELEKFLKKTDNILFICGPGNNGLDALFTAHKLLVQQYTVSIFFTQEDIHLEYVHEFDLTNYIVNNYYSNNNYKFIIDGIFGLGLNRNLNKKYIDLINLINKSSSTIISLDLPSGLNHINGELMPVSLKCDHLISLLTMKKGLFTNKGRDTWKKIINHQLLDNHITSKDFLITANKKFAENSHITMKHLYNDELHYSHKKSNGISCIVAGENPYHGAMILAASAAIKTGTKYVQVFTESEYAHTLPIILPQIIAKPFSISEFENSISSFNQLLIGPGTTTCAKQYVETALENINSFDSLIIDAGALMYIEKNKSFSDKLIITPHPGEAARLLNIPVSEVQADRYKAVRQLYEMFQCIIVLKGSGSIIYNGDSMYTCMDGNYKMATAGMGDVLCGILLTESSFLKNNLEACIKSVVYHSYSSDTLYKESQNKNITPSMVFNKYSELTHHEN